MYKVQEKETNIDGEIFILYGISDENGFYLDFTADEMCAGRFAEYLNRNNVEACHIPDLIEDLFYSCSDLNAEIFSETK